MKKSKVIIISLLGMLLFVPFMTSAKAQTTATTVSATEGETYTWDLYNEIAGPGFGNWTLDNMTWHFDELWNFTSTHSSITQTINDWSWADATSSPQSWYPVDINKVGPVNSTTGAQSINMTLGYVHFWGDDGLRYTVNQTFVNNTADLAVEQFSNGSLLIVPYWMLYEPQTLMITPNVDWTEFRNLVDAGLDWVRNVSESWGGYNLTVTALANGISIVMPANEFGNNSRSITMTATYYPNGHLAQYVFMYGADIISNVLLRDGEADDPVITVAPIDATVANNYTGESLSWTATDLNPDTYTISLNGTEIVSATMWTDGTPVVYNIPDALAAGTHTYVIEFADKLGNSASDTVLFTVDAAPVGEEEEEEEEEEDGTPAIPGFEPVIIIGTGAIATLGLIYMIKKRK
ncbi:hypothetical protein LCGC14_1598660 [marine sediment metagenome]|uniref:Bacterial Ig-like domain-containing protein n=1 Tax=marine sediment metagenome TaxID=412755 RepID=A0A0F9IY95_9ZZZZ